MSKSKENKRIVSYTLGDYSFALDSKSFEYETERRL